MNPDIVIRGNTDLAPYGIAGTVIPTPGHTAGCISVVLENGDAFVGDCNRSSQSHQENLVSRFGQTILMNVIRASKPCLRITQKPFTSVMAVHSR